MNSTPVIAIRDFTKRYGSFEAVSNLTLEVEPGSICGLLGPNGSGKTTTFKCLLGLARPSSGTMQVEGQPVQPSTFENLAYVLGVNRVGDGGGLHYSGDSAALSPWGETLVSASESLVHVVPPSAVPYKATP